MRTRPAHARRRRARGTCTCHHRGTGTRLVPVAAAACLAAIGVPTAFRSADTATTAQAASAGSFAPAADPTPTPDAELPPRPILGPLSQPSVDLGDGTHLAAWHVVNNVKVFNLDIEDTNVSVAPGVIKKAISINGSTPGPTIRVNQGERVRFIVHNGLSGQGTSVHWHGMDLPNAEDGVPDITQREIAPGGTFTYEWTAISAGTHWYHSHMEGAQEGKGLYGALEVVPAHDIPADRDYTLIFADGPLGFVINGRSFPGTVRMPARVGDRVRIRLISAGPDLIHSIHLHSGYFTVMAQDGHPLPAPYEADTIVLGVAQTYDLIWVPTRVGAWMIHCHIFQHSETKVGMTGMVTFFDVYPANGVVAPAVQTSGDVAEEQRTRS